MRIVHLYNNVECFDFEKSIYEMDEDYHDSISDVEKLYLNEKKIAPNRHLLYLEEYYAILISEKLLLEMEQLKGGNISGVVFVKPEEYEY